MTEEFTGQLGQNQEVGEPNWHDLSQTRKALRRLLKTIDDDNLRLEIEQELGQLNKKAEDFEVKSFGSLSGAKEILKTQKEHSNERLAIDQESINNELGSDYREIARLLHSKLSLEQDRFKVLLSLRQNPQAAVLLQKVLDSLNNRLAKADGDIKRVKTQTDLGVTLFQAALLVEYKQGLYREGHIAPTPSVQGYLKAIGERMVIGKPMFLHGPTGTGKTSLARFAARHFTGKRAEMVYCSPQTRESSIWGKTGIRPTKEGAIKTVDIFGPLARAMAEGRVIIFDEFTALPQEQMVFIKGIFNSKPGDRVNVVGNGEVTIALGFQMIFTANLKSEKNPERQELPPEIAREFEQNNLEVLYTPKTEAYDIMLARLLNQDGSIDLSLYDLQSTLPKFAEAIAEIQIAYTEKTRAKTAQLVGMLDAAGKAPSLKKLVFTQGTVETILDAWKVQRLSNSKMTFVEFLDQRLKTALTFKEYPAADRILAAKILASKGFLTTLTETELGLPKGALSFAAAKVKREKDKIAEIVSKSQNIVHLNLKEAAQLDPFKTKQQNAQNAADEFLEASPDEESTQEASAETPNQNLEAFLTETFTHWYSQETADKATLVQIPANPVDQNFQSLRDGTDASKFGEYTINPETQQIDWEKIPQEKIKILDLKEFVGKPLHKVMEHIVETYGKTHYLPGIELWQYIIEEKYEQAPQALKDKLTSLKKDGNYHFFPGSLVRSSRGSWLVPYAFWSGSGWNRRAGWLDDRWNSGYRVVLLEK